VSTYAVVDDQLLLLHLAGRDSWRPQGTEVATTASWWFRLARALERRGSSSLSRLVNTFEPDDREHLTRAITRLPARIAVAHPRQIVPHAAALSARLGLNLLAAEALATALVVDGRIVVSATDDGPRLRAAAATVGISYEAVEP
jgi:hypothetical protein